MNWLRSEFADWLFSFVGEEIEAYLSPPPGIERLHLHEAHIETAEGIIALTPFAEQFYSDGDIAVERADPAIHTDE